MKPILEDRSWLVFVGLFYALAGLPLAVPPGIWDEDVYIRLASHALSNPLKPYLRSELGWVPHPPLSWYLLAVFHPVPRMAPLFASTICLLFTFYVCRRLYGGEVAWLSAAILVSTFSYLPWSLITFPDGPVAAFMGLSVLSALGWVRSRDRRFLLPCGLGLALASMTKYTAVPILLATFAVWLVVLRRSLDWPGALILLGVVAVSLVPLALWIHGLSRLYGNVAHHYSSVFGLFPNNLALRLRVNLLGFAPYPLLLAGWPLASWVRGHLRVDRRRNRRRIVLNPRISLDSTLLLIYSAIVFALFVFITPETAVTAPPYNRYSLPMAPALTVISAKSLEREKPPVRHSILSIQFLCALIWELCSPPFSNLPFIKGF